MIWVRRETETEREREREIAYFHNSSKCDGVFFDAYDS